MSKVPVPRGRRPAPFKPRLEALEDRSLPAPVTFSVLPGNFLKVVGTGGNDHIVVFDNGSTTANNITVKVGPTLFRPGLALNGVLVKAGAGNDSVSYVLTASLAAGTARSITVDMGTGLNQFHARFLGALTARASLSLVVDGSSSSFNNIEVDANSDIAARAALTIQEIGGPGADNLSVRYSGMVAGALTVFSSGLPGADTISQVYTLTPGSAGTLSAQELGGPGNDNLLLTDQRVSLFDNTSIATAIDGGLGFNRAVSTSDVKVSNAASTRV